MSANRSSAVMAQRAEAQDSLDDFPTPPWATRALCAWIAETFAPGPFDVVREPACNRGHMARVLGEYFGRVEAADVMDYGAGYPVADYLFGPPPSRVNWTITNPPFRLAEDFAHRAMTSSDNVALLLRSAFLEGEARYSRLFSVTPPSDVLIFTSRVVMWRGVLLDPDVPIWRAIEGGVGRAEKPTTATSYAWFVWARAGAAAQRPGDAPTRLHWIAPDARRRLTRPRDYPPVPDHLRAPACPGDPFGPLFGGEAEAEV
jgi:hypothetical protein